jgi:hypothetical protein
MATRLIQTKLLATERTLFLHVEQLTFWNNVNLALFEM